jgi:hypothetical protein
MIDTLKISMCLSLSEPFSRRQENGILTLSAGSDQMHTQFEEELKRDVEDIKKAVETYSAYMCIIEEGLKSVFKLIKISCGVSTLWIFLYVVYQIYKY